MQTSPLYMQCSTCISHVFVVISTTPSRHRVTKSGRREAARTQEVCDVTSSTLYCMHLSSILTCVRLCSRLHIGCMILCIQNESLDLLSLLRTSREQVCPLVRLRVFDNMNGSWVRQLKTYGK